MTLRYLLDTNILSEPMRPAPDPGVLRRVLEVGAAAATGAPAWHELEYGRSRLPAGRRKRAIDGFLDRLDAVLVVLPYDKAAAAWHARERARLAKKGKAPPFVDGQLAAIAHANGLVLVTRNIRDFAPFADLRVESWFGALGRGRTRTSFQGSCSSARRGALVRGETGSLEDRKV